MKKLLFLILFCFTVSVFSTDVLVFEGVLSYGGNSVYEQPGYTGDFPVHYATYTVVNSGNYRSERVASGSLSGPGIYIGSPDYNLKTGILTNSGTLTAGQVLYIRAGIKDGTGATYSVKIYRVVPVGDIDGDGIPDNEDPDIDGDNIPNGEDPDVDGDGVDNGSDTDVDGDGLDNGSDSDVDGDGLNNGSDTDVDGDGVSNASDSDIDGDGLDNSSDTDDDGDGIDDTSDTDANGDGIDDASDPDKDTDGDGVPDSIDNDIDGDGIPNDQDLDIDGDGVPNDEEDSQTAETLNGMAEDLGDALNILIEIRDELINFHTDFNEIFFDFRTFMSEIYSDVNSLYVNSDQIVDSLSTVNTTLVEVRDSISDIQISVSDINTKLDDVQTTLDDQLQVQQDILAVLQDINNPATPTAPSSPTDEDIGDPSAGQPAKSFIVDSDYVIQDRALQVYDKDFSGINEALRQRDGTQDLILTIPLSQISDKLDDQEINFCQGVIGEIRSIFRGVIAACLYYFTLLQWFKAIRRIAD